MLWGLRCLALQPTSLREYLAGVVPIVRRNIAVNGGGSVPGRIGLCGQRQVPLPQGLQAHFLMIVVPDLSKALSSNSDWNPGAKFM
jgi:hypothetical protein